MSEKIEVRSPFNGELIGEIPKHGAEDVDRAVMAAQQAPWTNQLPTWRRAEILYDASTMLGERREDLARTIALESAKPISSARLEAARALSTMGWASIAARNLTGEMVPMEGSMIAEGKLGYTTRVPRGVVAAITPFNFPLNLACHKVGPALAAGCPVVLKPASQTPFSSILLAEILADCGLPDGWLNVVTGSGSEVGNTLVEHPDVKCITFTGSADVGWNIAAKAPRKKVALELGNSTPVIVEPGSRWEDAVHGIAAGGFAHAGQSCISVQRVYVHESIAEDFIEMLVGLVNRLIVGDPLNEATDVSSLITTDDRDRVHSWIREAVEQGAVLRCGGDIDGTVLTPAVLTNCDLNMKICREEVFGPVVAIQTYSDLDEAIGYANGTRYGLQAGIFTPSLEVANKATNRLDFGAVLVNEIPTWRADLMPYGGVKDSGNTREGPAYAIKEYMENRLVVINS